MGLFIQHSFTPLNSWGVQWGVHNLWGAQHLPILIEFTTIARVRPKFGSGFGFRGRNQLIYTFGSGFGSCCYRFGRVSVSAKLEQQLIGNLPKLLQPAYNHVHVLIIDCKWPHEIKYSRYRQLLNWLRRQQFILVTKPHPHTVSIFSQWYQIPWRKLAMPVKYENLPASPLDHSLQSPWMYVRFRPHDRTTHQLKENRLGRHTMLCHAHMHNAVGY